MDIKIIKLMIGKAVPTVEYRITKKGKIKPKVTNTTFALNCELLVSFSDSEVPARTGDSFDGDGTTYMVTSTSKTGDRQSAIMKNVVYMVQSFELPTKLFHTGSIRMESSKS